jgi:hypothetical protein
MREGGSNTVVNDTCQAWTEGEDSILMGYCLKWGQYKLRMGLGVTAKFRAFDVRRHSTNENECYLIIIADSPPKRGVQYRAKCFADLNHMYRKLLTAAFITKTRRLLQRGSTGKRKNPTC